MNKTYKLLIGLLMLCLLFQLCPISSFAKEATGSQAGPYTYTITFYAGNQGVFHSDADITIPDGAVTAFAEDNSSIVVTGLTYGSRVTFNDIQGEAVDYNEKYIVKGLRKGGYDNSERVDEPSIEVTQDQDYVVAYGIRGDMVSYEVRYVDASGRNLADSRTYWGNIGDRPVVAFLYINGYEPQAYNLTGTLSEIAEENIFTFKYRYVGFGKDIIIDDGETTGETTTTVVMLPAEVGQTEIIDGGNTNVAAGDAAGENDEAAGDAGAGEGTVNLTDEDVPLTDGPENLIDLDDDEVPLGGFHLIDLNEGAKDMLGAVVVTVTALAALIVLFILWRKQQEKEKDKNPTH